MSDAECNGDVCSVSANRSLAEILIVSGSATINRQTLRSDGIIAIPSNTSGGCFPLLQSLPSRMGWKLI